MKTENVYLSHANTITLILLNNGSPVDLSTVTRMTLSVGTSLIDSSNIDGGSITWNKSGYSKGEVRLNLGAQSLIAGTYSSCYLIAYDPVNVTGIVWGKLSIQVFDNVEAA